MFLLACVALLVCFALLRWWPIISFAIQIKTVSGALPVIGHADKFTSGCMFKIFKFFEECSRETNNEGGLLKLMLGPLPIFVITDPQDAATLVNASIQKNYLYKFSKSWLGEGLIVANPTHWSQHRKILNPAFNQTILVGFLTVFNREADRLVQRLETKVGVGPFEMKPIISHNALEVLCQTALGLPRKDEIMINEEYINAVEKFLEIMMERVLNVWLHPYFIYKFSNLKKEEDEVVKILDNRCEDVLRRRKDEIKTEAKTEVNDSDRRMRSYLDILLEHEADGSFSSQDVKDELENVIVAGHDTSTYTIMFILRMLGAHPSVQQRAYNEVIQVLGSASGDITKDDLPKLVYLEAVIKETLRLYPVIPLVLRELEKNVKLRGCTVPAGSNIMVSIWGINRSKCWGADADVFRPDRWLEPASSPETSTAFASFSFGRRGCIGKIYAMMSMKTTLGHLLRRYEIEASNEPMEFKLSVMLRPASKLFVSIKSRP